MKPVKIQIQNTSLLEGITKDPVICWQYTAKDAGQRQKACRIELRKDGAETVADTGRMDTEKQNNHRIEAFLESHCRYDVKVTIWNQNEEADIGVSALYVSGIDERYPWPGKWIGNGKQRPFLCYRYIQTEKKVKEAYLSVAASGQYECRINGLLPDESVLNGSWTDFHKRIHYRTFSITEFLKTGKNCISIEVGNGWYLECTEEGRYFYTTDKGYVPFGNCLGATAVISLVYEDGVREEWVTDRNWNIADSPVTYTNIYGSEDYDARMEAFVWEDQTVRSTGKEAVELEEQGPKGKLVPALYPQVIILRTYEGKKCFTCQDGSIVYDLGQNMAGFFEVGVKGEGGTKIKISCSENWTAGTEFTPSTNAWGIDTLKEDSGIQSFQPKFTYQAGRYVCISFMTEKKPEIVYVRGHLMSSSAEKTGRFSCSDDRYMQVYGLVERAVESNLHHVHTDCPTYERLGWQEPNHLMGPSLMYMKNSNNLWDKFEQDQCDSQYAEDEFDRDKGVFPHEYGPGLLPSIAPRYARFLVDGGSGSFWDIIPWGSSLIMGAWERKRFYGDDSGCTRYYDAMKRYVEYQYEKYLRYEEIYHKQKDSKTEVHFLRQGLGDWGVVQGDGDGRENIETAYLYRDMVLLAEFAGMLGKEEEQKEFSIRAEKMKEEYNELLLCRNSETGDWYYRTYDRKERSLIQAAQAIPLQFQLVPEEKRSSVERTFVESVKTSGILAGEVGMPYIFRTLGELDEMELAEKMIFREEHPSYYRFLQTGETTLPEFWRDDARSRNHDMMGSVIEWFYRYVAGLSSEDGYRTIRISPKLPEGLSFAECSYQAITGEIMIKVVRTKEKGISVTCEIPVNTEGIVSVGDREYSIQGGIHYQLTFPFHPGE